MHEPSEMTLTLSMSKSIVSFMEWLSEANGRPITAVSVASRQRPDGTWTEITITSPGSHEVFVVPATKDAMH